MVLWHEDAYTRTDENGDPLSFVSWCSKKEFIHYGGADVNARKHTSSARHKQSGTSL